MRGLRFPVLAVAMLALAGAPVWAQDVYVSHAECKPAGLGQSPSICGDDQTIARIEQQLGATARAFKQLASHTPEGELGRYLETHGYVAHSGVCKNRPDRTVYFLTNDKLCDANKIGEQFASRDADTPGGDGPGGDPAKRIIVPVPGPIGGDPTVGKSMKIGPGAGPCLPYGKGGYDYCQNPERTGRPPGCICPGDKAVTITKLPPDNIPTIDRKPKPEPKPQIIYPKLWPRAPAPEMKNPPSDGALFNAINTCLSFIPFDNRKFYYYDPPPLSARARKTPNAAPVSYEHGVVFYDPAYMATQSPAARAILYADAFAQHAQAMRDKKWGSPKHDGSYDDGLDTLIDNTPSDLLGILTNGAQIPRHKSNTSIAVGFIYRCLQERNLVPNYSGMKIKRDARDDFMDAYGWENLEPELASEDNGHMDPFVDDPADKEDPFAPQGGPDLRLRGFSLGYGQSPLKPLSLLPPSNYWSNEFHPEVWDQAQKIPFKTK